MANLSHSDRERPRPELHLRRMPVSDAMYRLDRYLDQTFLHGMTTVRIVHGKGTGAMREAVWEALSKHPLVKEYRLAYPGEGDAGVTVVEMEVRGV